MFNPYKRENTIGGSPLDGFELRCHRSVSSSLISPYRPEISGASKYISFQERKAYLCYTIIFSQSMGVLKIISNLVAATPIIVPRRKANPPSDETYMSAAIRRAATSSRNVRAYQTDELEHLYKELLTKRQLKNVEKPLTKVVFFSPRSHRVGMYKTAPSPPPSRKSTPIKNGKLTVLNIERPSSKGNNTINTKLRHVLWYYCSPC